MIRRSIAGAAFGGLALAAGLAQEQPPLKPFRNGEVPIRRAEAVRREPAPAPGTPLPVRPPAAVSKPPTFPPKPATLPPRPSTPRPAPAPDAGDAGDEIRIAPSNPVMTLTPDKLQLSIADGFYSKNQFDRAAPEYEKYLGIYVGGTDKQTVLFRLGESYFRIGSFNAARSSFQALLDQFSNGEFIGSAAYRLGEIYYQEKNYNAALPFFRKASVRLKDPKLANAAKFFTGRCLEAVDQKTEARRIYEELVGITSENPFLEKSRLSYALLLKETGRGPEALKQMQILAQGTENSELKAQATVYSGLWMVELGQNAKGEAELKRAIGMPGVEKWRDVAQFGLIQLAFNADKHDEVVAAWKSHAKVFGSETRPQVMALVAKSYAALKQPEEASEIFAQITEEFPTTGFAKEAGFERLKTLYRAEHPNLLAEIDQFLATNPEEQKRDQTLLLKAELLFKKQDFPAAAPIYEGIVKSRHLTGVLRAEVLTKLGWCYLQTKDNERAVKTYTELIDGFATFKSIPAALLHRAVAHLRLNANESAIKDLRHLIDRHPKAKEREQAVLQVARLLGQRSDNPGMMEMFKLYLRDYPNATGPEAAEANFWIGSVAFENKAYKEAVGPLKKAIEGNKEEFFERASVRLMGSHLNLDDKEACAAEIDAYLTGGGMQVPYDVLHGVGAGFADEAEKAASEEQMDIALEKHKRAVKYLGLLAGREDAKPLDLRLLGRSAMALGSHEQAAKAFTSFLAVIKEPLPRAEGLNDLAQAQIGLKQFAEAQTSVNDGLALQPVGEVNARLRITAGDIQAAQGKWDEAAKIYNSVTVIIDDENITPGAGEKAVDAYRRAGLEEEAKKLLNRLQSRYPEYFQNKKARTALTPR